MSLLDGIRERFRKRQEEKALTPSDMNRAGRRALGFRGHVSPYAAESAFFIPRYIRRHFDPFLDGAGGPRRQRKSRARIVRLVQRYRLS